MLKVEWKYEWKQVPVEIVKRVGGSIIRREDGVSETEIKQPVFDGTVTVKIPRHSDRIKFSRSMSSAIVDGQLIEDINLGNAEKIIEFAKAHIESVNLVRKSDNMIFNSVDMLDFDRDGAEVLGAIGNELVMGVHLGKN